MTDNDPTGGTVPQDELADADVFEADAEELDAQDMVDQLAAERDEYLDQLQRSRAEFINYRKRTDAEKRRLGEMFTANTLTQFLPVVDDFDRAMSAVPEDEQDTGWVNGITMIQAKLNTLLQKAGVNEVPGVNAPFDPAMHEAVAVEPGSSGDTVVEVYQKGYRLGETLLWPAMVKTGDALEPSAD